MRDLIFISHRISWPLNKGEKIRSWNLIAHLARDYRIHFGCVVDDPADMAHVAKMQTVCASVGAFPIDRQKQKLRALLRARPGRPLMPDFYHSPELQRWVDDTMARVKVDVVYIFSAAMAPYAIGLDHPCKILDAQDINSEKWAEYAIKAKFPMKLVWAREGRTLLRYERAAAAACNWTFFVSQPEVDRFAELAPEVAGKLVAIENGVDAQRFSPADVSDALHGSGATCGFHRQHGLLAECGCGDLVRARGAAEIACAHSGPGVLDRGRQPDRGSAGAGLDARDFGDRQGGGCATLCGTC